LNSLLENPVLRHFARIDARSLGLFRWVFGIVLLLDLRTRFRYADAFYSNEGVLPNHNHLFNLKEEGKNIWSVLHAFSTPGDAMFAMVIIAFFYLCFTFGWKTRAFHLLSFLSLISLTTRNLLAEGIGNYLAIAVLGLTWFLPLGSRFSIDSLKKSMSLAIETSAHDLNARSEVTENEIAAARAPGWSPVSFAALAVILQLGLVYLSLALRQTGAWRDGSAVGKALHVWTAASPLGFAIKDSGLTTLLTYLVTGAQWAVPVLLLVPVARGAMRNIAAALMAVHGAILWAFFNLGLFGSTLFACAFLVIATDYWDASFKRHDPRRVRTVIYDADCGICYWLCRLLKRLDTRRHLTFQPNDTIEDGLWGPPQKDSNPPHHVSVGELPKGIDQALVDKTVCVVSKDGRLATRAAAVAEVLQALPLLRFAGLVIKLPGLMQITNIGYDVVARLRTRISVEMGLAACGVPQAGVSSEYREFTKDGVSPARRLVFSVTSFGREALALFALVAMLGINTHQNGLPVKTPKPATLDGVAWYTRALGDWNWMVPEPPREQGYMVTDAVTRGQDPPTKVEPALIDVFTGAKPTFSRTVPFRLGQPWADYLARIQDDQYRPYQQAFRTYIGKGGPRWDTEKPENKLVGLDVLWFTVATDAPSDTTPTARRLFRVSRGGTVLTDFGNAPVAPLAPAPTRAPGLSP
jgi:predicted DCC family thiol-disulfide oxidoreductase YuxK